MTEQEPETNEEGESETEMHFVIFRQFGEIHATKCQTSKKAEIVAKREKGMIVKVTLDKDGNLAM